MTIAELVDGLKDTFVAKKKVRDILTAAGISIDPSGREIGEFNRLLNLRRDRESQARSAKLTAEREQAVADEANRREFERAGYEAEIKLLSSVEPHWPTYHRMIALGEKLSQAIDAARGRDVGDFLAYRSAAEEIPALLVDLGVDPDTFAGGVWATVCRFRRISPGQIKAMAVSAAKYAALKMK